jgi:hypothetical protein
VNARGIGPPVANAGLSTPIAGAAVGGGTFCAVPPLDPQPASAIAHTGASRESTSTRLFGVHQVRRPIQKIDTGATVPAAVRSH